jgi:hypothetical protein
MALQRLGVDFEYSFFAGSEQIEACLEVKKQG